MGGLGNRDILARNLAYYVDRSGKTQKELAEVVGVASTTFNDWMRAKKYPRIDKIEILANYFGILKSDLIEDKAQKPPDAQEVSQIKNELLQMVENLTEKEAAVLLASLKSVLGKE